MDLNDIKPPGLDGAYTGSVDQTSRKAANKNPTQAFAEVSQPAADQPAPLKAVAHLDKAVFQDPAKLHAAVRASVAELVDSGHGVTGPLSSSEKEFLTDFLSGDPLVRRQVEGLLRKVLS
jgi:hypothetical protein